MPPPLPGPHLAAHLSQLSPLRVLERGYAIVTNDQGVVRDSAEAPVGSAIEVRLSWGELKAALTCDAAAQLAAHLSQLSPLRVLERGYAIVMNDQGVLRDSAEAPVGSAIEVRLARGELKAAPTCDAAAQLAAHLSQLSPLRVLERGYAIVTNDQGVQRDSAEAPVGSAIEVRLARGELKAALTCDAAAQLAAHLSQLSPLRVLERGYAIVMNDQGVLRDSAEAPVGSAIEVRLARGELKAAPTCDAAAQLAAHLSQLSPLRVLERGYAIVTNDQGVQRDSAEAPVGSAIEVRLARGELKAVVS